MFPSPVEPSRFDRSPFTSSGAESIMSVPVATLMGRLDAPARPPRGRRPRTRVRSANRGANPSGGIARGPLSRVEPIPDARRRTTAFAAGSVDSLDADDDEEDDDPKMSKEELKRRAIRASAPRDPPASTRAKSSSGGPASLLPQLVDGAEVFFLLAAGGTRAATAYESAQRRAAYVAANPSAPPLPQTPIASWASDAALFAAVAAGAVIRRAAPSNLELSSGPGAAVRASRNMDGYAPTGVFARVKNLEMSQDRIAASVDRCNRDLSRVSTRVRATRRELSPSLRKVEARSDEQAQYSAAMERRLAHLGDEVKAAQETMMALTDMTAKQFSALSFAVKELKEVEARAQAEARAPPPVPAPVPVTPVPVTPAPKPAGAPNPNGEGRRRERERRQQGNRQPPPRPERKPWSGAGWPGAVELAAQESGGSFRTDRVTDKDGVVTETRQMNVNRRRLTTLRVGGKRQSGGAPRNAEPNGAKPGRKIASKSGEDGTGSGGSGSSGGGSSGGSGGTAAEAVDGGGAEDDE